MPKLQGLPRWDIKQNSRVVPRRAARASGDIGNILIVRQALDDGFGCLDFAECDEGFARLVESV